MVMKKNQFKKVKCSRCGKPAVIGFEIEEGIINACESCMCELGEAATSEEKDRILREMMEGAGINGEV